MTAAEPRDAVDELLHARPDHVVGAGVESAVRVAGGSPTLGGGVAACPHEIRKRLTAGQVRA
jgi:hypothetical protein